MLFRYFVATTLSFCLWAGAGADPTTPEPVQVERLDAASLKQALTDGGYNPKVLNSEVGKEKFSIDITRSNLNIPIGVEVSPSKRFIWFTANLGNAPDPATAPASRFADLLKANTKIQPAFFYITSKGLLMMGVPLENRSLNAASIRYCIDKLSEETVNQSAVWKVEAGPKNP